MKVTIGCDPELFVVNAEGKLVSAHGLIPGTKEAPHPVTGGAVQVDGMAVEFNTNPTSHYNQFRKNIKSVRKALDEMLVAQGYQSSCVSTAKFDKEYFDSQPEEAKDLGCDPDFNAWLGGQVNDKPETPLPMRTAAGHVHIGWTEGANINSENHMLDCIRVTKELDYLLGLPSLLWDKDTERRTLYGQAGAFRPKPYGCEYRVLSNQWLTQEHLTEFVFNVVVGILPQVLKGMRSSPARDFGDQCVSYINNSDPSWREQQLAAYIPTP